LTINLVLTRAKRKSILKSITMSCTAPAKTPPIKIQRKPGRYPNCAAKTGPIKGPAPTIAAKWCPKTNHLLVGIYSSLSF